MSETEKIIHMNNKRIAKNTFYLYFRTILIMVISLYTSRVILEALGVEDYGINNVVGGVVSMFSVITGALSASISRYITYELGKKGATTDRLMTLFSTSMRIQVTLGIIIIILGETIGLWFVNTQLNIPSERMVAAQWVWQCVIISFFINLVSVPYNASIIAHEHMNAFAIVSIVDAVLKLLICYLVAIIGWDKLIIFALLHVSVALLIRIIYATYCHRHFEECRYKKVKDKGLIKEMMSFAGFSFLNNTANILNSQGLNILINIFFGVVLNAARGIATQVEGAILQLVNNFTLAVNPQITKSYAIGDKKRMFQLVCLGSKFAYFMFLFIAIPVFLETDYILKLWLKTVPDYTVVFLRLSIIGGMVKMLGNTGYTACMATGKIKNYSIWITSVGILAFPLTWIAFSLGAPAEYAYYVFIVVYVAVEIVRLILMKRMLGFSPMMYVREVLFYILLVTPITVVIPLLCINMMEAGFVRLIVVSMVSILSTATIVYSFGLNQREREYFVNIIKSRLKS